MTLWRSCAERIDRLDFCLNAPYHRHYHHIRMPVSQRHLKFVTQLSPPRILRLPPLHGRRAIELRALSGTAVWLWCCLSHSGIFQLKPCYFVMTIFRQSNSHYADTFVVRREN